MNRWIGCAALASALVMLPLWNSTARALFILTLQSGASNVSTTDNGPGDLDPTIGSIVYSGAVGAFSTNITIGYSNSPGDSGGGVLQISSLDARNTSAGQATLTATLQDTGFTQPSSPSLQLASSIAVTDLLSTAGDGFTFQSYADPSNAQGGTAVTTGLQSFSLPTTSTPISDNNTATPANFPAGGPYSMMNVSTITLSASGELNESGTTTVKTSPGVPEPTSLALASAAGLMLFLARRRHARA